MSKKMKKKTKKYIIIGTVAAVVLIGAIIAIAVLPTSLAKSRYDDIFNTMMEMEEKTIVITDMGAENNFSDANGEVIVDTAETVNRMVGELAKVAEFFEYKGKEKDSGSWDIRYRVTDGEETVNIYLAEGKMYYVKGETRYVFEPTEEKAEVDYKKIYDTMCMFVR